MTCNENFLSEAELGGRREADSFQSPTKTVVFARKEPPVTASRTAIDAGA